MKHCETTLNLQQIWHRKKKKCEKNTSRKLWKTCIQASKPFHWLIRTGSLAWWSAAFFRSHAWTTLDDRSTQSHHVMWTIGAAALMCSIHPHLSLKQSKKYPLVMPEVEMLKSSSLLQAMLAAALCVTCSDPALVWTNHRPFSTS